MSVRPHRKRKHSTPEIAAKYKNAWEIDYYPLGRKGKRIIETFFGSEGKAYAYHAMVTAPHKNRRRSKLTPQVNDLIPDWKNFYKNNRAKSTYADAITCLKQLVPFFGNQYVINITPELIEEYKTFRIQNVSKRSTNKELSYFSSMLKWAVDMRRITEMPCKLKGFPPKQTKAANPRPLNKNELDKLITAIEPHYRAILLLMIDGGLRRDEALFLKCNDVDLETDIIFVKGKGDKERIVPIITIRLREELTSRLKVAEPNEYLTINKNTDKPYTHIRKALIRAAAKAKLGKHVHHHLLRHSFGTFAASKGVSLAALQDIMGHSDPKTTRIYSQLAAEHLKDATKRLQD